MTMESFLGYLTFECIDENVAAVHERIDCVREASHARHAMSLVMPLTDFRESTFSALSMPQKPTRITPSSAASSQKALALSAPRRRTVLGLARSTANEVAFVSSLVASQVQAFTGGVFAALTRNSARPTWSALTAFTFHFVRAGLSFQDHAIHRLRWATNTANWLGVFQPGPNVFQFTLTIDIDRLLEIESRAAQYCYDPDHWAHPPIDHRIFSSNQPIHPESITHLECEWIFPPLDTDGTSTKKLRTFVYFHGGAYISGSSEVYRSLLTRIARETNARILICNYRLAPEHPFPAALHDILAVYLWLIDPLNSVFDHGRVDAHEPVLPSDIIFMGDSAGGGLVMALINYLNLYLRGPDGEHLIPLPGACVLLSPWLDLSCSSKSWRENVSADWLPSSANNVHGMLGPRLPHPAYMYCLGSDVPGIKDDDEITVEDVTEKPRPLARNINIMRSKGHARCDSGIGSDLGTFDQDGASLREIVDRFVQHPLVSPICAKNVRGLPPTLIQIGECEALVDDSITFARKFHEQNLDLPSSWIRHESYTDMVHVFQAFPWLEATTLAHRHIAQFLEELNTDRMLDTYKLTAKEARFIHAIDSHLLAT